jgi:hypothetical protein
MVLSVVGSTLTSASQRRHGPLKIFTGSMSADYRETELNRSQRWAEGGLTIKFQGGLGLGQTKLIN